MSDTDVRTLVDLQCNGRFSTDADGRRPGLRDRFRPLSGVFPVPDTLGIYFHVKHKADERMAKAIRFLLPIRPRRPTRSMFMLVGRNTVEARVVLCRAGRRATPRPSDAGGLCAGGRVCSGGLSTLDWRLCAHLHLLCISPRRRRLRGFLIQRWLALCHDVADASLAYFSHAVWYDLSVAAGSGPHKVLRLAPALLCGFHWLSAAAEFGFGSRSSNEGRGSLFLVPGVICELAGTTR